METPRLQRCLVSFILQNASLAAYKIIHKPFYDIMRATIWILSLISKENDAYVFDYIIKFIFDMNVCVLPIQIPI